LEARVNRGLRIAVAVLSMAVAVACILEGTRKTEGAPEPVRVAAPF
jgi:hypothetical protein